MPSPVRAESVAEAQRLHAQGMKTREIAAVMGSKKQTVQAWLSDPDLAKQRARRERYAGICEKCGAKTDGSAGPGRAPKVCGDCLKVSDEEIYERLHTYVREHGEVPRANDMTWASGAPVAVRWGSWNNLLRAAGLPTRMVDKTAAISAERRALVVRLWHEGKTISEIADLAGYGNYESASQSIVIMRRDGFDLPLRLHPIDDDRVLALYRSGMLVTDIARELDASEGGVYAAVRRLRDAGHDLPKRYRAQTAVAA